MAKNAITTPRGEKRKMNDKWLKITNYSEYELTKVMTVMTKYVITEKQESKTGTLEKI